MPVKHKQTLRLKPGPSATAVLMTILLLEHSVPVWGRADVTAP